MEVPRYFWPTFSPPKDSYVYMHQIWPTLYPVMTMSLSTDLSFVIVIWNLASLTYLNPLLFETASADYTMSFALNLAFLHMIQDLWPGNFSQLPPVVTQEELAFPLGLTSNADFRRQDTDGTYPVILMHEPQSLAALRSSLRARGATPSDRKSPFSFGPRQAYPIGHH